MIRKLSLATLTFLGIIFIIPSCCMRSSPDKATEAILKADRDYSRLSSEKGMNAAFLAMFDSSGVILRRNHMPVEGILAIRELLESEEDTSFTLTWEPTKAVAAASGELGYSYGTYVVKSGNPMQKVGEGTYVTLWKKNNKGEWKAVLDTGNSGLKTPEPAEAPKN